VTKSGDTLVFIPKGMFFGLRCADYIDRRKRPGSFSTTRLTKTATLICSIKGALLAAFFKQRQIKPLIINPHTSAPIPQHYKVPMKSTGGQ
tara:strand:- start:162 stop:434 length:273 start_codon:yes stop_codon:yes gene_type:complete